MYTEILCCRPMLYGRFILMIGLRDLLLLSLNWCEKWLSRVQSRKALSYIVLSRNVAKKVVRLNSLPAHTKTLIMLVFNKCTWSLLIVFQNLMILFTSVKLPMTILYYIAERALSSKPLAHFFYICRNSVQLTYCADHGLYQHQVHTELRE